MRKKRSQQRRARIAVSVAATGAVAAAVAAGATYVRGRRASQTDEQAAPRSDDRPASQPEAQTSKPSVPQPEAQTSKPSVPQPEAPTSEASEPSAGDSTPDSERNATQPSTNDDRDRATWTCQCGQEFRVSGRDRHRLFWLPDAEPKDPVLDDRCPSCDRQLSAEQAA